jgi:hypothetical protein
MVDPLDPVTLERLIVESNQRCFAGVDLHVQRYEALLAADTEYEHAKAQAFLAHDGPQTEKRPASIVATYTQQKALDRKKVEFEYAKKRLDVLLAEQSSFLNMNKTTRAMFNADRGVGG